MTPARWLTLAVVSAVAAIIAAVGAIIAWPLLGGFVNATHQTASGR